MGFLGLLLLGKAMFRSTPCWTPHTGHTLAAHTPLGLPQALPDAVFAVLRNWAGIRGAEQLGREEAAVGGQLEQDVACLEAG